MAEFEAKLQGGDFHVLGHRIEMYGYCRDCDKREETRREKSIAVKPSSVPRKKKNLKIPGR